jgi:hypothetical protein
MGMLELPKEVVEKVSAASGTTLVHSKIDYSMSLLSLSLSRLLLLTFEPTVRLVSHILMVLTLLHLYRGGCLSQSGQGGARCCHFEC